MNGHAISFGPYRLLAAQRLLLEGDQPVRLGSRAFDILEALVERAGEVVGKEELIARAWPKTYVEESEAAETAESLFRPALDEAHQQEVLSWALCAATSLARLLRDRGRADQAVFSLRPVYDNSRRGLALAI